MRGKFPKGSGSSSLPLGTMKYVRDSIYAFPTDLKIRNVLHIAYGHDADRVWDGKNWWMLNDWIRWSIATIVRDRIHSRDR